MQSKELTSPNSSPMELVTVNSVPSHRQPNDQSTSTFETSSPLGKFVRSLSLSVTGSLGFTGSSSESSKHRKPSLGTRASLPVPPISPLFIEVPVDTNGPFSVPLDIDGRSKYHRNSMSDASSHPHYHHHHHHHHHHLPTSDGYHNGAREAYVNLACDVDKNDDFYDTKVIPLETPYKLSTGNGQANNLKKPPTDPINLITSKIFNLVKSNVKIFKMIAILLYNLYLIIAIRKTWSKTESYCQGVKLLVILTCLAYVIALYYLALKKLIIRPIYKRLIRPALHSIRTKPAFERVLQIIICVALICIFIGLTIYFSRDNSRKIISALGIFVLIGFGYLISVNRSAVRWRQVIWGISLQFLMALIVLKTETGKDIFKCIGDKVTAFLSFTDFGSKFVFGNLVEPQRSVSGELATIFAFKILPIIIFFSFTISILYYFGVMQIIVIKLGWFLQLTIGSTAAESLSAAGNIFLGMTETPLLIKPYLPLMTQSELFAVMTEGFATIAGSVLAAYINFGINASYLISASVMAAPSSLAISKLVWPETEKSKTKSEDIKIEKGTERNALEAGANGAAQAVKLCACIAANLIALMAFINLLNSLVSWFGSLVDMDYIDFEFILSRICIPLAWIMGVERDDTSKIANLLGKKTFLNEFVAYTELARLKKISALSGRSEVIATFALCGFSNICSIGIQMGGIGSLAPHRKPELASMAFRSMVAGSLVTYISACMAGLLYTESNSLSSSIVPITDQFLMNTTHSSL